MFRTRYLLTAALTAGLSWTANAQQAPVTDPPEPPLAAQHVAKAKEIAGQDAGLVQMATEGYWCLSPAAGVKYRAIPSKEAAQPLQLFDNLYMFGTGYVSTVVLKTNRGLIVWDALDNEREERTIFEPGLRQFGLNPTDIKYVILTHGHGDHYGGAKYLQDTYHVPIGLSEADWDLIAKTPPRPGAVDPPKKDKVLTDGQEITVGDATVKIILTPGHTPATVSSLLPVKDKGVTRIMAMWGGTAYPGTTAGLAQMRTSIQRFQDAARAANAAGILNTHAFFLNVAERMGKRSANAPNPLVLGVDGLQRTLAIQTECLDAQAAWYTAMGK